MRWTVIIPMSSLDRAKTRLADASSSPARHRALVRAMRRDTVRAVLGAPDVARLVVVTRTPGAARADVADLAGPADHAPADAADLTDPPGTADADRLFVIADPPHDGLNPAVVHAAALAAARWPAQGVAVVVADLPALTAAALQSVLDGAAAVDVGVVLDRQGMGTTMLTARPGHPTHPRFGAGSARRHLAIGAVRLDAPPAARTDVDVLDDLDAARRLGLGPAISALLRAGELPALPSDDEDRAPAADLRAHPDGA